MRIWICMIAAVLTLSACGSKQAAEVRDNTPRAQNLHQNATDYQYMNQNQALDQNGNGNMNKAEKLSTADHLEKIASQVDGVKSAHAVMVGNAAVVGINVDGKLDRSRVGTIKYSVAEALNKDPHGANALVTADVDLTNRLAEVGNSIRQGKPIKGMADELADIIGRIVPQMPGDTNAEDNQRKTPNATGQPSQAPNAGTNQNGKNTMQGTGAKQKIKINKSTTAPKTPAYNSDNRQVMP